MLGVHDAGASLCLAFILLSRDDKGLIGSEQYRVCPFFQQRITLFGKLHLPAVITAQLVRLFKLAHLSMSGNCNIDTG